MTDCSHPSYLIEKCQNLDNLWQESFCFNFRNILARGLCADNTKLMYSFQSQEKNFYFINSKYCLGDQSSLRLFMNEESDQSVSRFWLVKVSTAKTNQSCQFFWWAFPLDFRLQYLLNQVFKSDRFFGERDYREHNSWSGSW